jgi:hypothetical protein
MPAGGREVRLITVAIASRHTAPNMRGHGSAPKTLRSGHRNFLKNNPMHSRRIAELSGPVEFAACGRLKTVLKSLPLIKRATSMVAKDTEQSKLKTLTAQEQSESRLRFWSPDHRLLCGTD